MFLDLLIDRGVEKKCQHGRRRTVDRHRDRGARVAQVEARVELLRVVDRAHRDARVADLAEDVRARRGVAAVEFALVAPVLLLFVLGIIEFGRLMMVEEVLTNAAREGCRRAVMANATENDVRTVVNNYLSNSGISGGSMAPIPGLATAKAGDPITVTVSVPFDNVSWLPVARWLQGKTLSASVVMRKESNNT
jgi:Flp pilus assembly protein TadG